MNGSEIFVPRIPSIRIVDLAKAMAPNCEYRVVGIRPGEKLNEIMCPEDDSHLTIEYEDHYVIALTITFYSANNDFTENALGELGVPVEQDYEYNSGSNSHFLSVAEIADFNITAGAQS
jgi:UDP-N-acetylglucosamine 4,6-dehydratase